jgi:hypothetical protein
MASPGIDGGRWLTTRTLVIVVVFLWVAATTLAVYYVSNTRGGASAAGTASTTSVVASLSSSTTATTIPPTTTTEAPTTTTTEPPPLIVAAGGDVMGDRKVGKFVDENGGAAVFAEVKPYMENADVAFVNLEGAISDIGTRNEFKEYTFRARPALVDGLVSAGINVVSLANNHSLDYRWKALSDCMARLDAAGVSHAGAGANFAAASAPAMLTTPAGSVAIIAAQEISGGTAAKSDTVGMYYTSSPNKGLLEKVAAVASQVDFLIVSLHWGSEYQANAGNHQIELGHQLVDAGADLILGHHPHVIQALEIYKDRLIAYSLGDFVFDHYSVATGQAFVLQVTMPKVGPPSGRIIPVYLSDSHGIPAVVTGNSADAILNRLTRLSADRGLQLSRDGDTAIFGTPPTPTGESTTSSSMTLAPSTTTSAPTATSAPATTPATTR